MSEHPARSSRPASSHEVSLHIDELILHGFAPADRYRIAEAVEHEVTRLLADRGVPEAWTAADPLWRESVNVPAFSVAAGSGPEQVGFQIAEAVYDGINPGDHE